MTYTIFAIILTLVVILFTVGYTCYYPYIENGDIYDAQKAFLKDNPKAVRIKAALWTPTFVAVFVICIVVLCFSTYAIYDIHGPCNLSIKVQHGKNVESTTFLCYAFHLLVSFGFGVLIGNYLKDALSPYIVIAGEKNVLFYSAEVIMIEEWQNVKHAEMSAQMVNNLKSYTFIVFKGNRKPILLPNSPQIYSLLKRKSIRIKT